MLPEIFSALAPTDQIHLAVYSCMSLTDIALQVSLTHDLYVRDNFRNVP